MNISKIIIFLIFSLVSLSGYGQVVGVGINSPNQILHIHSPNIALADTTKDIVFSSSGRLGIGTLNPDAMLHIKTSGSIGSPVSGFQLQDGSESNNYVLVSDQDGYATWKPVTYKGAAVGVKGSGVSINLRNYASGYGYTGNYIDLSPGRWLVNMTFLAPGAALPNGIVGYNLQFSLGDGAIATPSGDLESNKFVKGIGFNSIQGVVQGAMLINNKGTTTKRYYLLVGMTNSPYNVTIPNIGIWGEDVIFAFLMYDE